MEVLHWIALYFKRLALFSIFLIVTLSHEKTKSNNVFVSLLVLPNCPTLSSTGNEWKWASVYTAELLRGTGERERSGGGKGRRGVTSGQEGVDYDRRISMWQEKQQTGE